MKNLKKIVFGLLAMLVMVTSVSAASGFVAETDNIGYADLDSALAAAVDGSTVKLLDDATLTSTYTVNDMDIIIDL